MKFLEKDKFFIFLFIFFAGFAARKIYSFVQVNQAYSLRFNPYISNKFKQNLIQYLKENSGILKTGNITQTLTSDFDLVKSVVATKNGSFKCHLKIDCMQPLVQVGDKVFAQDGLLHAEDFFEGVNLPTLQIKNLEDSSLHEFKDFVEQALDWQLFESFDVEWQTKNSILLQGKSDRELRFLTKHNRFPNGADVELLKKIIGEKKGSKGHARADLRFAGQVIISFV